MGVPEDNRSFSSGTDAARVAMMVRTMAQEENPFQPRLEGAPLLLTLDARSIPALEGEDREQVAFLCELCLTPAVDGLWTWGAQPLGAGIPQTELRPQHSRGDDRAVGVVGQAEPIGGVAMWSSHERLADQTFELTGDDRDWFLYYSTTTKFHVNKRRHFFVTADDRLLSELLGGRRQAYWQRNRVVSVHSALAFAGRAMRAREAIYHEAEPGYTNQASPFGLYFYLGPDLAPSRIRLHRWLETQALPDARELEALEQSMHDRVIDLLKARDHIALQNARHQDNATLDDILYHLRAAIGGAAALFDSIAVFAQLALGIDARTVGGQTRITLPNAKFRTALRQHGAPSLADAAADLGPLFKLAWSLRNVVMHGAGIGGSGYLRLDGMSASESRVSPTVDQAAALDALAKQRREDPARWGVDRVPAHLYVEPQAFSNRFCLVVIEAADRLVGALADDLGAAEQSVPRTGNEERMIRRFRWLSGLPSSGFFF